MGKTTLNKHIHEAYLFKRRTMTALVVVGIFTLILLSRLIDLQIIQHQFFSTLSRQNLLSIIPLKPSRGLIYDRNGVVLAKNVPSYSLALIPEKIKNIPAIIEKLKKIVPISDDDIKQFNRYRNQYRQFDPIPLKMKLSEEEIANFYVNQPFFSGVVIETRSMRFYPLGDTSSEIVGYVGRINQDELRSINHDNYDASDDIGKNGIEKYYENILHGHIGSEEAEINATGHIVRSLKKTPPTAGKNLYLTIDSRLQSLAHELLGNENGSIVVIKPDTGEVLALVSHPTFDANIFSRGITQKEYQDLLNSPHHPLFNRAIHGQYPAASTVKPFIALGSLDSGIITPTARIYDPGWFRLPNTTHVFRDWVHRGHGWVNVTRAIEVSCDSFFYQLAARLGINELDTILSEFGFGKKTQIDLPGEESGLVPSPEWKRRTHHSAWYTGDTVETGIGQGFLLVTPLQLAFAATTMANRGLQMQPHLLFKTMDEAGNVVVLQPTEEAPVPIVHPEAWDVVINAMQQVIDGKEGTARLIGPHDVAIAGKTGTAQTYGHSRNEDNSSLNIPKELRNHHLFIAFAPVDHPQIALSVIVEHSTLGNQIAGKLIHFYLKHRHENS
ncbi:MAG: penicillin-binding protein 2 [Coxiella sp. RIFCSPHIGHO2_12_FULL_42_15]|nr:MAG: penicillin-binding protein 2 [Coxiella sp. RIFCSPHIGHO2_12_FULL_42_15]